MMIYRTLAETIESFERGIRASRRPEDRKLAEDYLAALAPLLARAVLGQDILRELPVVERLFGQTWLIDQAPFEAAFGRWRAFKDEYERSAMGGMTVNERLTAAGILDSFDQARTSRNREEMVRLLRRVHVDEASIAKIVDGL